MSTFYNRATLTYGNRTVDSNTVQGELSTPLSIAKTALHDRYRPGDLLAFAVTLVNAGATDAENLTLTDDLGAYGFGADRSLVPMEYVPGSAKYFVNGELQGAVEADPGAPLTIRGIRVPAGGDAAILYSARVNDFAPQGEGVSITNTVRLDAGGVLTPQTRMAAPSESSTLPLFASEEVAPEAGAQLSLHKELNPAAVSAGEPLTYTLRVENSGATAVTAQDGATVADRFDPPLDIRSVRYNGAEWSAPVNYSYDPAIGTFATAAGQIEVPAATFTQDPVTGRWQVTPGASTIEITGALR